MSQKHRTSVILRVTSYGRETRMRVKLDANKFPYIIVNHERYTIATSNFPVALLCWGDEIGKIEECLEGLEELKAIIANPDLTTDKLKVKNMGKMTGWMSAQ